MQKWEYLFSVTGTHLHWSASPSLPSIHSLSTPSFHLTTKTTALKAPLHRALFNSQVFKPFSSFSPCKKPAFTAHLLKGKNQQAEQRFQHHLNLLQFLSDPAASSSKTQIAHPAVHKAPTRDSGASSLNTWMTRHKNNTSKIYITCY